MLTINLLLMILAFVCLLLAAIGVNAPRVTLGWLGLAFWCLALMIHA